MKTRHIKGILFSALIAMCATGCSDDLGNYNYTDINKVNIAEGDELVAGETYSYISHYDHMKFSPKLESTFDITDDASYEFEWSIIPNNALSEDVDFEDAIVCRERTIDYLITLRPGNYNCYFKVRDKSTGVTFTVPFKIEVTSTTNEGWLVLCDVNDKTRLDLIFNRTKDDDMIFRDMLAEFDYEVGKPQRIMFNYSDYRRPTILVTDKDTWLLDDNDLHAGNDNRLAWDFGVTPDHLNIKASAISFLAKKKVWAVLDQNDDLYTMTIVTEDGTIEPGAVFLYPITRINGEIPFKPAPFLGIHGKWDVYSRNEVNPLMIYDQTHCQFLVLTNTSVYPEVMTFEGEKLFDNPTGKQLVWMETVRQLNNISCVLRDPSGDMYYYAIGFYSKSVTENGKSTKITYQNQEGYSKIVGPDIRNAEHFAFHSMWNYLFYSVGNSVYKYDLTNPDAPAVKAIELPGEEITLIRFNPLYYPYSRKEAWKGNREYNLIVASTVTGKEADECGIVRFYDVPELSTGQLTVAKTYEGFGKVVDIVCKEPHK